MDVVWNGFPLIGRALCWSERQRVSLLPNPVGLSVVSRVWRCQSASSLLTRSHTELELSTDASSSFRYFNCLLKRRGNPLTLDFFLFSFIFVSRTYTRDCLWWVVETSRGSFLFLWRPKWAYCLLLKASFISIRSVWSSRGFFRGEGYSLEKYCRKSCRTHRFHNRKGVFSSATLDFTFWLTDAASFWSILFGDFRPVLVHFGERNCVF